MTEAAGAHTATRPFNPWPAAVFVCLAVLAVLFLAPTLGVLLSSLKSTREIALGELWALPGGVYLDNFGEVLDHPSVRGAGLKLSTPSALGSVYAGAQHVVWLHVRPFGDTLLTKCHVDAWNFL